MEINLTKTATFVTADSMGVCAVLCEFPQEKTGDLAGQGFLQGMAGIPKESADLSNPPILPPKPLWRMPCGPQFNPPQSLD